MLYKINFCIRLFLFANPAAIVGWGLISRRIARPLSIPGAPPRSPCSFRGAAPYPRPLS